MFFARLFGDWFDFSLSLEETLVHFIWWNTIDHLHYDVFLSKERKILKRSILHSSFHFQLSLFNPELSNSSICSCNLCCPTILQRICLIKILVHIPSVRSIYGLKRKGLKERPWWEHRKTALALDQTWKMYLWGGLFFLSFIRRSQTLVEP